MLLDAVNGDWEIFRSLAALLLRETHLRFDAIVEAASAGDARSMGFAAHTLKGSVANVGAEVATTLLLAIEHAGLREERVCEAQQLDTLRAELVAIRDEVASFLDGL